MTHAQDKRCPICGNQIDESTLTNYYLEDEELVRYVSQNHPGWSKEQGACSRCLEHLKGESSSVVVYKDEEVSGEQTVITAKDEVLPEVRGEETGACLITIHGQNLGKKYDLNREEVTIGRSEKCAITVNEENISRMHASIKREGNEFILSDLDSTNGTFINTKKTHSAPLADGDLVLIGNTILKFISGSNLETMYHQEIYRLATLDGLTQAYNKAYLIERLTEEFGRSKRYGRNLSLLMIDFDSFKKLNDEHGHQAGDYILREAASQIMRNMRKEDVFGRYGGEEFTLILPETPLEIALTLAEKLRQMVESSVYEFNSAQIPVTVSIGVSSLSADVKDFKSLLVKADRALYDAKGAGRNQVKAA